MFTVDDLRLIVERAHDAGLPVTAHAHAAAAVDSGGGGRGRRHRARIVPSKHGERRVARITAVG